MSSLPQKNLLAEETSPYLLQHRDNPVHWRAWGPQALAEAEALGKPILLSVGYAACHWCHVMAHESFEDPATAAVMNAHFVNVKVDREERPDIDQIYMNALHALGQPGGWPLTMFLTPGAEPFWGGTYFPRTAQYGRPSFTQVLTSIAAIFQNEAGKVEQNRAALAERIAAPPRPSESAMTPDLLDRAAAALLTLADRDNGGMGGAPKFPQASVFELFWRAWRRTGESAYRDHVVLSLERIAAGGIYDHLAGGFARYSVDGEWRVPHFEKMLYDNAQLLGLYAFAWTETGRPVFKARIEETVAWLEAEMRLAEGAYASSLDADTGGVEGAYYSWDSAEIAAILGEQDAAVFGAVYDVREGGNFEGRTVLNRLAAPADLGPGDEARLAGMRARLLERRRERPAPARDDKALADWNAMAVQGLARAGLALGRADWLDIAERVYRDVRDSRGADGRVPHARRAGARSRVSLSSDYVFLAKAALALHEARGERRYLDDAVAFAETLERLHWDEARGGYTLPERDAAAVIAKPISAQDEAVPSANGAAAELHARLYLLTGQARHRERADRLLATFTGEALANAFAHASLWNAFDTRIAAPQVVLAGPEGAGLDALRRAALAAPDPARVVATAEDGALPAHHPAHGKRAVDGRATAYVCVGQACTAPLSEPTALEAALAPGQRAA